MLNNADYDEGFRAGLARANEVALDLEIRWRNCAQKTRAEGTFNTGWPFRRTFVAKGFDRSAKDIEAAADGIRAIRTIVHNLKPSI